MSQPTVNKSTSVIRLGLGIAISVIAVLCIVGLTYYCIRQRRRKAKATAAEQATLTADPDEKHVTTALFGHKAELDSTPILEGCGESRPVEMQGDGALNGDSGSDPGDLKSCDLGDKRRREVHELEG